MKFNQIDTDPIYQKQFSTDISRFNLQRGKLLSFIIIGIELLLLGINYFSRTLSTIHTVFDFDLYAVMYILNIIMTALFCFILIYLEQHLDEGNIYEKALNPTITIFAAFIMIWGAVVSLLDQALYGNIVVFLVNMLIASFLFYLKSTHIIIPQIIATLVLIIGLPYFQPSRDILIGHYINISIFLVFVWILARTNYMNYIKHFINQKLIEEKSALLAQINDNLMLEIQSRKKAQQELEAAHEQLMAVSYLDYLTGIPNRRRLDEFLIRQWSTAVKQQIPISIMMIDIDFFKLYNDTNGHIAGDRCLQAVAGVLNRCTREGQDFVARYGGEEFLFVTTDMNKEKTRQLGEKIRTDVEALGLEHCIPSPSPYVTISIGINWLIPTPKDLLPDAIGRADQALYQAKRAGRNRVVLAAQAAPPALSN